MIQRFSIFLSYLFHPIFLPLASMFILFQLPIYYNYRFSTTYFNAVYLFIFINLVLIPLGVCTYLKRLELIQSLRMTTAKERRVPFLLSSLLYILTFYIMGSLDLPLLYLNIFKAITVSVIILSLLTFINLKWSAHLSAMGALIGMLIVISSTLAINLSPIIIILILLSGILASARLVLSAHSLSELVLGFCLGLGTQLSLLIAI